MHLTRYLTLTLLLCHWGTAPLAAEQHRVVSLAPSITETIFALGASDALVGVSTYCDHPEAARQLPRVGTFLTPNMERILAAQPTLVIAVPSPGNRGSVESLSDLGFETLIVRPDTIEGTLASIAKIGDALGYSAQAKRLESELRSSIARIERKVRDVPRPRVLLAVGRTPLIAPGSGSILDEMIRIAGGDNLGARAGKGWPHLGIEAVLAADPEIIIDVGMGTEQAADAAALAHWGRFPTMTAVRNNTVYAYHGFDVLRPGPRIDSALKQLSQLIHPKLFGTRK